MFDTVKNFITNPTPEGLFAIMVFILAACIVAKIAHRMEVWKGKSWYKASMLDLHTVCRMGTATGSVEAKIISDKGEQIRLEYPGESEAYGNTNETIIVPFTLAPNMVWTVLGTAKQVKK